MEDVPTPQSYLMDKSRSFLEVLEGFFGDGRTDFPVDDPNHPMGMIRADEMCVINFLMNIDFWDWEMECILESFSTISIIPLVVGAERIVPIMRKGDPNNLLGVRKEVIKTWNDLIEVTRVLFSYLDEEQRDSLELLVEIDFDVYLKS